MSASKLSGGILRRQSTHQNTSLPLSASSTSSPMVQTLHGINLGSPMQARRAVYFEPPANLRDLLFQAANDKTHNPKIMEELEGHLTHLRNQRGTALVSWLQLLQENISTLKPKLENFVIALLKIAWANQEPPVVAAYRSFLTNLVSAQGYYVKPVVRMLISNFIGFTDRPINVGNNTESLMEFAKAEREVFNNTHLALQAILQVTPLASLQAVLQYAKECMPYALTTDTRGHTNYIENLLRMMSYLSSDQLVIFRVIVARLVELDAHLPHQADDDDNEDLFKMENTPATYSMAQVARNSLDQGLLVLFKHIRELALDASKEEQMKQFYFDFLKVFESTILPVYATGHVQFLMFYLLSFRPGFVTHFLDHLWKIFSSVNTATILRQSAIAYIASLIARAKYVKLHVLQAALEKLVGWVHAYIDNREPSMKQDFMFVDIKAHGAFYAACQAALYMFAFRHEELVQGPKNLAFLRSLQFNTIVTCQLNPLRVCLPPVVKNFSAIARNFQLAYCDTIIQRNSRINLPVVGNLSSTSVAISYDVAKPILLDSFFPFDPYRLEQSRVFIQDMYREYQGQLADDDDEDDEEDDGDEDAMDEDGQADMASPHDQQKLLEKFMLDGTSGAKSKSGGGGMASSMDFVYGTSPGFLS